MTNLPLDIRPGQGIGPFQLGAPATAQLAHLPNAESETRDDLTIYSAGGVSIYVEDDRVTQIGVEAPAHVAPFAGLLLGQRLDELPTTPWIDLGDGVLVLDGVDGLCFSTEKDLLESMQELPEGQYQAIPLPRSLRVTWIGVHELPDCENCAPVELI